MEQPQAENNAVGSLSDLTWIAQLQLCAVDPPSGASALRC